jgi:hypothetical protein
MRRSAICFVAVVPHLLYLGGLRRHTPRTASAATPPPAKAVHSDVGVPSTLVQPPNCGGSDGIHRHSVGQRAAATREPTTAAAAM